MLRRVIAFGQELAGTLRRASVVDALMRQVRENFAPTEIALSLFHHDVDTQDTLHAWPPDADRVVRSCWSTRLAEGRWSSPMASSRCSMTKACRRSPRPTGAGCSLRWSPRVE